MVHPITLEFDDETLDRLRSAANERAMTPESVAHMAVAYFLAVEQEERPPLQDWQLALVDEGLAAAERGDFATPEEVERVFAKYR